MLLNWIKGKITRSSVSAMIDAIDQFTLGLRGADSKEIAIMLVIANTLRVRLQERGVIIPAALDFSIPRDNQLQETCDITAIKLVKVIQHYQKIDQPEDASAVMIWLHSARALNVPQVRLYGRALWAELSRGFGEVEWAIAEFGPIVELEPSIGDDVFFVPIGLEPNVN